MADKMTEKEMAEKEIAEKEMAEKEMTEKGMTEEEMAEKKMAEKGMTEEEMAEKKMAENKMTEEKMIEEKMTEEKMTEEEMIVEETIAEEMIEEEMMAKEMMEEEMAENKMIEEKMMEEKMIEEKMIEEKDEGVKISNKKLLRVYPKAFAVDERLMQSLVIFEDSKSKVIFSIVLGDPTEIAGLIKDPTYDLQSPYRLTSEVLKSFDTQPKKAVIHSESGIYLYLKQENVRGFKKLQIQMSEMLGLWNIYDFPIYSKSDFIDSVRHMDLKSDKEMSQINGGELYKVYGQKYLM